MASTQLFNVLFSFLVMTLVPMGSYSLPANSQAVSAERYLQYFGYMEMPEVSALSHIDHESMLSAALRGFQRMAGLRQTGRMDVDTYDKMHAPRCGNRDVTTDDPLRIRLKTRKLRRKRYVWEGSKWPRVSLTYRVINYSPDMNKQTTDYEIKRAFDAWSTYSPLRFTRTSGRADIDILFARRNHNDPYPFDGPGSVLAHAFFPSSGGDIHMDDDESFTSNSYSGTNFFQVFAHEVGHALGLAHSQNQNALMAAFYRGYIPNFRLHSDDIAGIQAIYGRNPGPTARPTTPRPVTPRPTTPQPPPVTPRPPPVTPRPPSPGPGFCPGGRVDAITRLDGRIAAFRGSRYVFIDAKSLEVSKPRSISKNFPGLPNNLDAAVYWPADASTNTEETTYFFKGKLYWRYNAGKLLTEGYPRPISTGWRGLPDNLDAAFVFPGNGMTYFIKDGTYYPYSRYQGVQAGRPFFEWSGVPAGVDAAFQSPPIGSSQQVYTYFFKGGQYYRLMDEGQSVAPGYPRSNAKNWFKCKS